MSLYDDWKKDKEKSIYNQWKRDRGISEKNKKDISQEQESNNQGGLLFPLLNQGKAINIDENKAFESLSNMNYGKRASTINATTKNKNDANKLNLEVLKYQQEKQVKEKANQINNDMSNKNYASAISHIVSAVPQKALDTTSTTFAAMNSIIAPKKINNSIVDENELLKTNKLLSKKYEQTTENIDNDIVKTSSQISGTIGGMVPSIVSNIVLPGSGTITQGINVGAQEYQETLNDDASNKLKAGITGTAKGIASGLIEKISGGNILGKGSLDDVATKFISKQFKGKAGQKLASKAYEMIGEIGEENLENQVGYVIDKIVNNKDLPNFQNWWSEAKETTKNTFLTTLVLNVLGLGGNTYNDVKNLEQKQYIDEAKKIIRTELNNNTDVNIDTKINELNNINNVQNIEDYNNIVPIIKQTQNQNQTSEQTNNIPIDKYNISAKKYNIDTNNETVQSIKKVTEQRGINTTYNAEMFKDSTTNAIWGTTTDTNGNTIREVILNPKADTNKTLQNVIVHELTHDFEGTKEYTQLADTIMKNVITKTDYETARKTLEETYSKVYDKNSAEFKNLVDQEAVADVLGNKLGNQEFVSNLTMEQPSVAKRIYNWVIDKLNKITGYSNERIFWTDVKNKFENAYRQDYKGNNNNLKYSIQTDNNGNKYVKVDTDQDIFNGIAEKDYNKIAKMYMQDYLKGKTNLSKNDIVSVGNKGISKYTNPKQTTRYMTEKMKLSTELKNALEIAQKDSNAAPTKDTSKYPKWEYYKFNFELGGKNFEGTINIGIDKDGNKHFYEINKTHFTGISSVSTNSQNKVNLINENHPTSNSHISVSKSNSMDSIKNSIAPTKNDVNTNTKYSMQESRNNTLNNKWEEFLNKNYKNVGTGETIKDVKLPPIEKKKIRDNTPIAIDSFSNSNNYIENNVNIPTKEYFENKKMQEELSDKDYDVINKIYEKEGIEEKIPNNKETNLEKYNKNKAIIIKENEKTINDLISFKNYATNNIDTQIKQKQELLKTIAEPERADIIKKQIENLKDKKAKMEEKYNADIDKFNSKNTLEKVEMKTRTIMKEEARNIMSAEIKPLIEDLTKYKDKKAGILYNRETAQRNIQDIVKDKELAKTINETIFDPVQVHQAEKTRIINDLFKKINDLEIDKTKKYEYYESEEGPIYKVDEATLAQLIIEKKLSDTDLRSHYHLSKENITKIHRIANTFTEILNNLYDQMNEVQIQYGYTPIGKIKNYFPHFFENKTDTTLGKIASYFGIDLTNQDLPTEIAGKTDTFKPGRTWDANIQKRRTNKTDYNALAAMEKYISGAADLIYTTQDIQKIREYSRQIRYKFSDKGMQEAIDNIYQNENLSQEAKDAQLDGIFENTQNELSKFVTWLDDYANGLANKKSFSDRNIEREAGRQIYSTMSSIESRIAANIIGGNLSVSLTNFAPLFQSMGTTKPSYIVSGMLQTTKNNIKGLIKGEKDTSFVNNSNFLTNRFGVDSISEKNLTQKISDITSIPMNAIDEFTAESIVRAKYLENLDKGMSEEVALDNADKYSAKIMADRSKGAIPLIFNKKNPIAKLMTMFQVEPNNIVSNYLKDMPRDAKSKTQLTYQYTKLIIASYAFNTMAMAIRGGSEVLPDPIRIVSNLIKMLVEDDDDEKEKAQSDLMDSIVGSTPFLSNVAGLVGMEDIGRIPISNAMLNITNIGKLFDKDADSKYKKEIIEKELSKPLLYLGLPVGGAQLKKTIEGIAVVNKGGSYKTNKEGEKQLQFPVENKNAKNYLKAGVFGKWSLDEAQMYTKTLTPKQTKSYEESKIPYKEYLEYLSKNLKKKEDKINYLSEQNWNENQKWGIYKNEILSNTERKEDGGSQLKDAEYIISEGISKTDFMNLYNKAQLNDIDIPTQKDYKKMERAGISLENYIDYKVKEKTEEKRKSKELTDTQDLRDKDKIQILLDSNYSIKEIASIYENYIKSSKDTQYDIMQETGIDIKEYLKYKQQDFESDRKDDGTVNGKAISKSKQKKEYEYVNNMKITYNQKLILLGMQYSLTSGEKTKLANYVNEMNLNKKEKLEVYEKLKGFKVYKDGRVTW